MLTSMTSMLGHVINNGYMWEYWNPEILIIITKKNCKFEPNFIFNIRQPHIGTIRM